ncbi:DEAD/DEAH box helicase [bacterium LRH843]|nr:DEAD/DEAH box helicase [bacterium LRH843]
MKLPMETVNQFEKDGLLLRESGLEQKRGTLLCRRCGTSDASLFGRHFCAKCKKVCSYCRHCLTLGKVSECQSLYHWAGPEPPIHARKQSLVWQGKLSSGQKKASDAVIEAVETGESLLVWAVCGAGKTEVLFRGLERAFEKGMRVLLATPRTDVVKELYPRLHSVFPQIPISALYGGSKDKHPRAQLVIATTHQVMRFYRAFDVVIIDEVDAFPYSVDQSLQYAVEQAKRDDSATIYLSATPSKPLQKSDINLIKIPLRYHGFPLPEPTFEWCGNWSKALKQKKFPPRVLAWIQFQLNQRKQALLFVPSISTLTTVSTLLTNLAIPHAAVHAKDGHRHETTQTFRDKKLPLLVTTTILERGVTFPGVQVAILGSENDVFTEAALVQMAGRVGRSADEPSGDVIFYHYGVSKAMRDARSHIRMMNKEGESL